MKILLVDDTRTDRLIMMAYLNKLGHEVVCGEDGQQAIRLYKSERPDLVIMDVIMPVMDGHQAATRIRENDDTWIPIIFLSARVDPEDIARGIDAGGDDYLTKPVDHTVLAAKMKAMQRISAMRHRLLEVSAELEKANDELRQLAHVDGLTGLSNRRYLDQFLRMEISRSRRYQQPLAVILADVDYFKRFNDHYGHLHGDDCLKKIARAQTAVCQRSTDLVARYGGEEFAIILPDTDVHSAEIMAERLRSSVQALAIQHEYSDVAKVCTLSLGVASGIPGSDSQAENLLQQADAALYQAKQTGRNRFVLHKPE